MDTQVLADYAKILLRTKMYPYFDIANYILMCWTIREDNPYQNSDKSVSSFAKRHPLSSYVSSMLLCFAGGILGCLLSGEPLFAPFKDHQAVLTATAVWYLINYSPFDIVYRLTKFLPVRLTLFIMKEILRTYKIHHGILYGLKHMAGSYVQIVLYGTVKGTGSKHMRHIQRVFGGRAKLGDSQSYNPSFVTKGSLFASIVFLLRHIGVFKQPSFLLLYFGIVIFFVYFKLMSALLSIHDPFSPFENLFCGIFCGGIFDAFRRAKDSRSHIDGGHGDTASNSTNNSKRNKKSSEEKKNE